MALTPMPTMGASDFASSLRPLRTSLNARTAFPASLDVQSAPGHSELIVPKSSERALLKHYLAAIAYRAQKALRDAPADYPEFSAGHRTRTPVEILRHMTSLLGYSRTLFLGGSYPFTPEPLATFEDEVARFHDMVSAVGDLLERDVPLQEISYEQFLQGPLSDVMTHIGQLALLRRLAGAPVAPENFIHAQVNPERLGPDQAPPARPDADWPERPA